MKLQQTPSGYWVSVPKIKAEKLGRRKGDTLDWSETADGTALILKKVPKEAKV